MQFGLILQWFFSGELAAGLPGKLQFSMAGRCRTWTNEVIKMYYTNLNDVYMPRNGVKVKLLMLMYVRSMTGSRRPESLSQSMVMQPVVLE